MNCRIATLDGHPLGGRLLNGNKLLNKVCYED